MIVVHQAVYDEEAWCVTLCIFIPCMDNDLVLFYEAGGFLDLEEALYSLLL